MEHTLKDDPSIWGHQVLECLGKISVGTTVEKRRNRAKKDLPEWTGPAMIHQEFSI